MVGKKKERKYL